MFKKTMKFDDLEGNEVEQTFYFNYNKKELGELLEFGELKQFPSDQQRLPLEQQLAKLSTPTNKSGLTEVQNSKMAYGIFHDLILDAYGEKGDDNVTFVKDQRTRAYFSSHVAFVELIFELMENPSVANQFLENCLPAKAVAAAKEDLRKNNAGLASGTLTEMVEEAERRQLNPETRVEPGEMPADADPEVAKLAVAVADQPKKVEDLTEEDILNMSKEELDKLNPRQLTNQQMQWAWRRKTQG